MASLETKIQFIPSVRAFFPFGWVSDANIDTHDAMDRDAPRRILSAVSDPQPEPEPDESFNQVARVDEGFLAWNFIVKGSRGEELASIDRTFTGFGREMFTDTGRYFVRFGPRPIDPADPTPREPTITRDLSLEERAVGPLFCLSTSDH